MLPSHNAPIPAGVTFLLLWLSQSGHCQYNPFGGPQIYPDPHFAPFFTSPEDTLLPQGPHSQHPFYPALAPNNFNEQNTNNFINPFLPASQGSGQQQVQGSYPNTNLAQIPFQTVTPNQAANRYPFQQNPTLGNFGGSSNQNNLDVNPFLPQQNLGNTRPGQSYPNFPNFPFQTVQPGQGQTPIDHRHFNNNYYPPTPKPYVPRVELPRIRVIEYPSSEFFEYGGGKLVQPKRPNSDLYIGGNDPDVPLTSRVFIECTGPNQVEWLFNSSSVSYVKKNLSVVTKNFQITIPEQRDPASRSREYTYLRLGLEQPITEHDSGVYICRDRILPQNYISISVRVPSTFNHGGPPWSSPGGPILTPQFPQPQSPEQYDPFSFPFLTPQIFGEGLLSPPGFGSPSFGHSHGFPSAQSNFNMNIGDFQLSNPLGMTLPPPLPPISNNGLTMSNPEVLPAPPSALQLQSSSSSPQALDNEAKDMSEQQGTGRPNYPFRPPSSTPPPVDPNTIYFSLRRDETVTIPCKIMNEDATISLHKHEDGKLSCPYVIDGRILYDRFKGFIINTRSAFQKLEGRYVCIGDFKGDIKLMKYKLVSYDGYPTARYLEGEPQKLVALDSDQAQQRSASSGTNSASAALLAKANTIPKTVFSGITIGNLTSSEDYQELNLNGEFDIEEAESASPVGKGINQIKSEEEGKDKKSDKL